MKQKKVLVVGPGYVGLPLALDLTKTNEVHCLSRHKRQEKDLHSITYDLLSEQPLQLPSFDWVVYLPAAKSRKLEDYQGIYLEGLKKVMTALPQLAEKFIFVSSTSVYGEDAGAWVEEKDAKTESPYGQILLEAEALVQSKGGMVVRFGGIYGPQRTRFIDSVIEGKLQPADYENYTNRIHRDDCVKILTHILSHGSPNQIYNGVDNDPATKREIVQWMDSKLDRSQNYPVKSQTFKNKRVSNLKLVGTGYKFIYPTFREGYKSYLEGVSV